MVKYNTLGLALLFICCTWNPLHPETRQSVSVEILGSGGLGSLNWEKFWPRDKAVDHGLRVGVSIAPIDANNGVGVVVPVTYNTRFLEGPHQLELGVGQGFTVTTKGSLFVLALVQVGWVWQTPGSPWFLRVAYTPLVSYLVDFQWQHWGGVLIGLNLSPKRKP